MMMNFILSIAIWTPISLGILLLILQKNLSEKIIYKLGNIFGLIAFLITIPLYIFFDTTYSGFQFQEIAPWISHFSIQYHLGLDGISLPLVMLTSFITWLVIFISSNSISRSLGSYIASFLILSGLMIGVFLALDAILYYVFWEAMLIPMFLLIGVWGGPNRVYATIKFFLYTVLGSLLMLVAFIYLFNQTGSFSIVDFYSKQLSLNAQVLLFVAFFMAFAVKIPMWPVHTWLPDAHVEAPTGGSVILAAIMLKLGAYSFIRFAMPIAPDGLLLLKPYLIAISLIAIVYIALVAIVQTDMKKLIAYSSISHMGFVTLGLFMLNPLGFEGGYVQMISHGFISAALFFSIGVLYDRMHTREIKDYGGIINSMPVFGSFFVLFAMANSGLPGTSGFVGEFLVILGAMQENFWIAFLAALTLIFGATYSLWLVKRIIFGVVKNKKIAGLVDLNAKEFFVMSTLAGLTLIIGIYPALITDITNQSSIVMLELIQQSKI
jgi:NADH-quinone oxidoreductase subunit M